VSKGELVVLIWVRNSHCLFVFLFRLYVRVDVSIKSFILLFIYQHMHNFLKYNVKPQVVKTLKLH